MSRRLGAAALVTLAVAGCSSGSAGPSPSPSVASIPAESPSPVVEPSPSAVPSPTAAPSPTVAVALPPCFTSQLRLTVGQTDGGAGQFHQRLVLTNASSTVCSLHGYPGVSFLDAAGKQLGSPADANPGTVNRVRLAPGAAAVAVLTYSNAGAFPDSTCRPQEAARVRVYPPGQRDPLTAADKVLVCAAPGSKQLRIDPVEPA